VIVDETYSFRVHYREPVMRRLSYDSVFHWLGGRTFVLSFSLIGILYAAYLIFFGVDGKFAGFITALVITFLGLTIYYFVSHRRRTLGALKRMKSYEVSFTLTEDNLTFSTDAFSSTMRWSTFKEIQAYRDCWLLAGYDQYRVALPTEETPEEALAFVRLKIPKFKRIGGSAE
jgi:hypothetical protein